MNLKTRVMSEKILQGWESVKDRVHDTSGVETPSDWMWENTSGIFYPSEKVVKKVVVDEMFNKLDPDMSEEEIIGLGYEIKMTKLMGENIIDWREGCGHTVTVVN